MKREFTSFFPFCGLGAGALGFIEAQVTLLGRTATFRSLGGIDVDPLACVDFEYLTKSPALCADVSKLTPAELRAFAGDVPPDVVFMSPPCKGFSGLLSKKAAKAPRYEAMNRLVLDWTELMLSTWDTPPKLVLLENVPRIATRGAHLLAAVRKLLRAAGYVFHARSHDCGELGGLAQHRTRYLLVARHPGRCASILYQPPKRRVRACGEVLGQLPLPEDPRGGPTHKLPKLSWLNWVRLALIPAGGDWRDLEGVLREGQARREVFRRHHVGRWDEPVATVAGSGSNGPTAIADPRFGNVDRVVAWDQPTGTVTSSPAPSSGAIAAADPRVRVAYDHGYGVLRWDEPSSTIAGGSAVGQGAYSVADVRFDASYHRGTYGVIGWEEAAGTITGNARPSAGRFTVADPRKPPERIRVIIAADGTWHRPLTTLELAAIQDIPTVVDGKPLVLAGTSNAGQRERIGNAVPRGAARAIAEQMLVSLVAADAGTLLLSTAGPVWVTPTRAEALS